MSSPKHIGNNEGMSLFPALSKRFHKHHPPVKQDPNTKTNCQVAAFKLAFFPAKYETALTYAGLWGILGKSRFCGMKFFILVADGNINLEDTIQPEFC